MTTTTLFSLLTHGPGVRLWAWPLLVGLGAVLAVLVQLTLAARVGLSLTSVLVLSLVGCALGFVGGKIWYLVVHRKSIRDFLSAGACIQGFLLVALGVLVVGGGLSGISVGTLLDVTAPGVFLGMAVGRPGCLLSGCCAGRPTTSRWGVWSSDRRLAVRRYPVQLGEAATALVIGIAALLLVATVELPVPGLVGVGAFAAYTLARQLLFPFRVESHTRTGRIATIACCGLVLVAVVWAFLLA